MTLGRRARDRILRIVFFVFSWFCMAFMLVALVALTGLTHVLSEERDVELPLATQCAFSTVFLCLFGVLVLAALVKEPFMVSGPMSLVANSVLLLVATWLFAVSVWAFILAFHDIGFRLGG